MRRPGVLNWGVTDTIDPELRRVTILSNGVYLVIRLISLFYLSMALLKESFEVITTNIITLTPIVVVCVCLLGLYLNLVKQYWLSRSLFMATWVVFTTLLIPFALGSIEFDFIIIPVYAIISSVMVQIVFSWYRERWIYLFWMLITWLIIIFFVEYISYFRVPDDTTLIFVNGLLKWRIFIFMVAAFLNVVTLYMVQTNHRMRKELERQNFTVLQQNERLESQRISLEELTKRLADRVENRTHQLNQQNERISEYSYFNSHILRAPVSRIRGLVNLLSLPISNEEEIKVRKLLTESMNELDDAIKTINERLQEVNP